MESETVHEDVINSISNGYSPLTESCKADFKATSKLYTFEKRTLLVKEGQHADKIYFIIKGCTRAFYMKDGKDISDWFAFENEFTTAVNSFFQQVRSPHFIELVEQTTFLEISRENVYMLSDKYHDFDRLGRMIITDTMLRLRHRITSMQFETAQQKYENLIKVRPDIALRIPLKDIASYLGITLETLSRIRNPRNRI